VAGGESGRWGCRKGRRGEEELCRIKVNDGRGGLGGRGREDGEGGRGGDEAGGGG